jgi:group I intron endonuclease
MAYIYIITNTANGKFYIGKAKNLNRRWNGHKRTVQNKEYRHPLYDSMRKYGTDKFTFEVLEKCNYTDLDNRERYWIAKLKPVYNLTEGGEGGDTFTKKPNHMKDITRKKLSEAAKKKAQDPEYRKKLSEAAKKKAQDPEYRKKLSEAAKKNAQDPEYIKKVSEGVKRAIETKKHIWSECKKGSKNNRWLGYIEMYDPDGSLYKTYESAVECQNDIGIRAGTIRGKAKSGKPIFRGIYTGYTFKLTHEKVNHETGYI